MGESVKLTKAQGEFVAAMRPVEGEDGSQWVNFYPDFQQGSIAPLFRRGWFEKRGQSTLRQYRWTDAGRAALPPTETPDA